MQMWSLIIGVDVSMSGKGARDWLIYAARHKVDPAAAAGGLKSPLHLGQVG